MRHLLPSSLQQSVHRRESRLSDTDRLNRGG